MQSISGGFAVIVQLGNHLAAAGHDVCFVIREYDVPYTSYADLDQISSVKVKQWADVELSPNHVWIVPEGWSNALTLGINAGARCIVYMQNWAFALRALPNNTRWDQLPVDFLHISEPVRWCLEKITSKNGPILRPGVDTTLFSPPPLEDLQSPVDGALRIAWMPRKNKVIGEQIQDALMQRLAHTHPKIRIEWVEIHRLVHEDVAKTLRSCHIFLSTGFPEGCPLPPLEAMASGCLVVGFAGLGGWDYMRQIALPEEDTSFLANPTCPLRNVPFEGNGLYVPDADVLGATLALEQACKLLKTGGQTLAHVRKNLATTANSYANEALEKNLSELLPFFTA